MKKKIGVSFSSDNIKTIELLEKQLSPLGIKLQRYDTKLIAQDDIPTYMENMKTLEHCFVMISQAFLCSPFCIYELANLLTVSDKIILVYLEADKEIQILIEKAKEYWRQNHISVVSWLKEEITKFNFDKIFQQLSDLLKKKYISSDELNTIEGTKQILEILKHTPDGYISELKNILAKENFYERELAFADYLRYAPANEVFNHYKALSFEAQKYIEGAEFFLRQAISINPLYVAAYTKLFDLAFNYPDKITIEPDLISQLKDSSDISQVDQVTIYKLKGILSFKQAKQELDEKRREMYLKQAIDNLEIAKKLSGGNDSAVYNCMGQAYELLGDLSTAVKEYSLAVEKSPENHVALNNLALFCDKYLDETLLAKKFYEDCLNVKPDYKIAQSNYALLMEKINVEEAIERYISIICSSQERRDHIVNLALILEEEKISERLAGTIYRVLIKFDPNSIPARFNMANFMRRQGFLFDDVMEYLKPIMQALPHNDMVLLTCSLLYYRENNIIDALKYCMLAINENPYYVPAIYFKNYLDKLSGVIAEKIIGAVLKEIKKIQAVGKNHGKQTFSLLYCLIAELYLGMGDKDSAKQWYKLACQYDKRFHEDTLENTLEDALEKLSEQGMSILEHDYTKLSKGRIYKNRDINLLPNDQESILSHLQAKFGVFD